MHERLACAEEEEDLWEESACCQPFHRRSVVWVCFMAYPVYCYCSEYCCCYGFAVFGVFVAADHAVVVVGEHAADCAEDDDGEDGDDDAG